MDAEACDWIYVFDKGRVIDSGSLMSLPPEMIHSRR